MDLGIERGKEIDPIWKDLSEKKQIFRRHVESLAAELKDARARLASREQSYATEALTRQEAENRARKMEEELCRLQKSVDERDAQLQASSSVTNKFVKDLDNLRCQVSAVQATADASAESAQSAQLQCQILSTELNSKKLSLNEHGVRIKSLEEQLNHLQNDLQANELSQNHLRNEVLRIENHVKDGMGNEFEPIEELDEFSPRYLKNNNILMEKDQDIVKLREEMRIMSAHWKLKAEDLASQLEQHGRDDLELKKRVLKLEFCLHEARSHTRKLQRAGERRDKVLKELKDELATKQGEIAEKEKKNFWETSGFKIVVSMSMLILVLFSRR